MQLCAITVEAKKTWFEGLVGIESTKSVNFFKTCIICLNHKSLVNCI